MVQCKSKYEKGEIVFVSEFEYSDGKHGVGHLFVIIDEENMVDATYFGMLVSSQLKQLKHEANIGLKSNATNGLKKDSLVKCDALYSIKKECIMYKIGDVDVEDYLRFIELYEKCINR